MGMFDGGESSCVQGTSAPQRQNDGSWGKWVRSQWVECCPICRQAVHRVHFPFDDVEIPELICRCESQEIQTAFRLEREADEECHRQGNSIQTCQDFSRANALLNRWIALREEAFRLLRES